MHDRPAKWETLRSLFEEALQRRESERAAFLDEQTQGDARLRSEIESLLAAHDAAGEFLSAPGDLPATAPRLPAGTALGAFTILEPVGAGGMGEVYRARDTRLDRFVAVKILSPERDTAPGARERFEREARAISRLSHPRICTVHDVSVAQVEGRDVPFLVMELLDGVTLAGLLSSGPLPIEQALSYAIDIADALVAAHSQGIVHRDLKPANVMVTSTGVKLLDFGLAQLRPHDATGTSVAAESSVAGLTSAGRVFGTLPYMSPEQLRGERVDARTDVFAFGALLHEMLTGRRPFEADSQAGLIAAILEHDAPPVSELQPLAPANLDRIVRKCLAKNPDDRWQTARDLKSELVWVRDRRDDGRRGGPSTDRADRRRRWIAAAVVALPTLAALMFAAMAWRAGSPVAPEAASTRNVTRLSLNLPPGVTLDIPINGTSLAIAPDGGRIAFIGSRNGRTSLFIHSLDSGRTLDVPDTAGATNPMFSPDSQWVGFAHGTIGLRKLPAAGGPIQLVTKGTVRQMTWLTDDRIVRGGPHEIRLLDGQPITRLGAGEEGHNTPVLLANGSLLLTILRGGFQSSGSGLAIWPVNATDSSKATELLANATSPRLVDRDTVVFAQGRSLMAAGFDSRAGRMTGEPHALDVQVQTTVYSGAPMYALAANGTLVYPEPAAGRRLVWIDRQGREEAVKTDERMYSHLRLSPDGTRVATYVSDADRDLWVLGLEAGTVQRLTSGPARDAMPVWSPDGSHIFFTTAERIISRIPADRSTPPEVIFSLPYPQRIHPLSITTDGKRLLTHWDLMPKEIDLRVVELGEKPTLTALVGDSRTEHDGRLSPDGKWLAYQSAESADDGQIVVRSFTDIRAQQHVISKGGGNQPIWSRDGREIFYRIEDGTVMSVPVTSSPAFKAGAPVRVMSPLNTLWNWGSGPTYDVSPDGQRFLFIKAPELDIRSLTVVLNWDVAVKAAIQ
jgi:serine/threonine protein kinase